jgi:hypothetical protein
MSKYEFEGKLKVSYCPEFRLERLTEQILLRRSA